MKDRKKWADAMFRGRQNATMARYAMPRDLRPTFALLARNSFATARFHRTFGL
ncbi:hypothetical protein [Sphingomonas bisphenolicum]|uniref:hypothetical protein n=1 Tax=Sphingomonas bisphenolicum TaxID=296544 RepID=UPI0021C32CB7|nr:hypothetical protein [Sphingomonas bisphenolicum]